MALAAWSLGLGAWGLGLPASFYFFFYFLELLF
jgi:hypothetical protein